MLIILKAVAIYLENLLICFKIIVIERYGHEFLCTYIRNLYWIRIVLNMLPVTLTIIFYYYLGTLLSSLSDMYS